MFVNNHLFFFFLTFCATLIEFVMLLFNILGKL